jgi:hypothetical protein
VRSHEGQGLLEKSAGKKEELVEPIMEPADRIRENDEVVRKATDV